MNCLQNLPVIQCSTIVRCRSCRTYINPFVYFVDSKKWKCNLCFRINECKWRFLINYHLSVFSNHFQSILLQQMIDNIRVYIDDDYSARRIPIWPSEQIIRWCDKKTWSQIEHHWIYRSVGVHGKIYRERIKCPFLMCVCVCVNQWAIFNTFRGNFAVETTTASNLSVPSGCIVTRPTIRLSAMRLRIISRTLGCNARRCSHSSRFCCIQ